MLGKVKVQEFRIERLYGIQIDEYTYDNVEKITFDTNYKDEEHTAEPCFTIVMKVWNERGYKERKTATFWCENTQILIDRE